MKNFVQLDFFYTELSKPKTLIQQSGYRPMMRLIKWSKDINKLFFMASRIWWNPLLVLNVILFKISFWIWMLDHLKFLKVTCISKYHQHIHSFSIFWFHIKKISESKTPLIDEDLLGLTMEKESKPKIIPEETKKVDSIPIPDLLNDDNDSSPLESLTMLPLSSLGAAHPGLGWTSSSTC